MPAQFLAIAAREGRFESEGWRVRKDGSRFWASVVIDAIRSKSGELLGFAKVTRDITERRAAQEALLESERQFRLLVAGVTDYALFMLDPNGIVTSWNAGAERIKGYTSDEILGQHFSRFYTERDRAAGAPTRAIATAISEGHFEADGWRVRKDGSMFWANVVIDPIRDERGTLIGFAKITRDITERREAQLALQKAQAQRAQTQKMDALGQLTGGVAHDFNNLLMVVSGHVPMLKRRLGEDPKAMRSLNAIELAVQRGATLTRQLLTFARRQNFDPVVCKLPERIDTFSSMLASSLGATVRLITTIGAEIWPVKVDASELELAMVNLVLNARDAMPEGGKIVIETRQIALGADNDKELAPGSYVCLSVTDSGEGMDKETLARAIEPFFTTKGVGKGTGLGLAMVHGMTAQMGGSFTLRSKEGRGSVAELMPAGGASRRRARPRPISRQSPMPDRSARLSWSPSTMTGWSC